MNNIQFLVMIAGGSGSGKSTLANSLIQTKKYEMAISHTTRTKRKGEIHGRDYYFVDNKEFDSEELIERIEFGKNKYGLSAKELTKTKKDLVFVVEPNGIIQILNYIEEHDLDIVPIIIHLNIKEKDRYKNMIKRGDKFTDIEARLEIDEIDIDMDRFEIKPNITIKKLMDDLDKHILSQLIRLRKSI